MNARHEDCQPKGTYVTYVCRNDRCPNYVKSNGRYRFEERDFEGEIALRHNPESFASNGSARRIRSEPDGAIEQPALYRPGDWLLRQRLTKRGVDCYMATWLEVRDVLERLLLESERLGNEILRANITVGAGGEATRQVYVHRCTIPANDGSGDMEYIAIDAPVAAVGEVDLLSATAIIGQYNPCVIAYLQGGDVGYLCAGTRILADIIDASNPSAFLLQVHFVAFASYQLSAELANPTGTNAERATGARRSAWQALGRLVSDDPELTVEREWPDGKTFVFSLQDAGGRRYEFFMSLDDRGGDDAYAVIEYALGALQGSDLGHAVEAAYAGRFGVVSADGFASFRVSHNLTSLSTAGFKKSMAYLVLGVERFESARASA